jgi:hypothetical protein
VAEGKWTPGKIFLLVVGILLGLGILCCGGGYLLFGEKIKSVIEFGTDTAAFVGRLRTEFGDTASFDLVKNDKNDMVLAIGVPGELTPEKVPESQDKAWRAFADSFGKHGFVPVRWVAIGRPIVGSGSGKQRGTGVVDWSANMVSTDELVRRTGVPAPPLAKFLPEDLDERMHGVKVDVKVEGEDDGAPK